MQTDSRILIGEVVGAQGLRGELRVHTFTESPADLSQLKTGFIFVRAAGPNMAIVRAGGIEDRAAAEKLRGARLFINRSDLPKLPAGEHYITDLIGMKAGGRSVADVHNFGAGDILELDNGDMVRFNGASVDYEKKEIKL